VKQGVIAKTGSVESTGKAEEFKAPFDGEAVLYLKAQTNRQ